MKISFTNPLLFISYSIISLFLSNTIYSQEKSQIRYLHPVFDNVSIQRDVEFAEVTNFEGKTEKLMLDVYSPDGDKETLRPVILWFHGGGFRPGNDKKQDYIVKFSKDFAKRGYVCVSVNYRIRENPKEDKAGTMADALKDAMSGLSWIRSNQKTLGIDPQKIIVGGGSAGGMLTVNFGFRDQTPTEPWDKSGILGLVNLWGSPEPAYLFSTIDKNDPPMIIIHGKEDKIVPFEYAVNLEKQLEANQVRHEFVPLEGAGHTPMKQYEAFVEKIAAFVFSLLSLQK
jgi:acetyl esterase/lipase